MVSLHEGRQQLRRKLVFFQLLQRLTSTRKKRLQTFDHVALDRRLDATPDQRDDLVLSGLIPKTPIHLISDLLPDESASKRELHHLADRWLSYQSGNGRCRRHRNHALPAA